METDKPQISILMAVYEPRMDWLKLQLESLNRQTYPNIKLYIRDDCSPTVPHEEISKCVAECIRAFPYELRRNEKNAGSNQTFEWLTQEAEGEYFAYCDQDDIWLPEKLSALQEEMEKSGALLVCSDMYIIDGDGKRTADSITKVRRHHIFRSGEGLAKELLVSNFVAGCTMMMNAQTAKDSMPFCPYMVHDQYLALCAAAKGKIVSLPDRLIQYRIHSNNQTLAMAGVHDRESYVKVRIQQLVSRLAWLEETFHAEGELRREIVLAREWAQARECLFRGERGARRTVWKHRRFSPLTSLFEVVLSGAPDVLFMFVVNLKRKNIL